MASTISAGTTTTTALVYSADTSGVLQLQTNGTTTAVTIDTSQRVLIGTTSGSYGLVVGTGATDLRAQINGSTQYQLQLVNGSNSGFWIGSPSADAMAFSRGDGVERARIDSSGNLLVGTTNSSTTAGNGFKINPNGIGTGITQIGIVGASSDNGQGTYSLYSSTLSQYQFYVGYGGTVYARSTSITGLSDQREKENIRALEVGLNEVLALQPRRFDWKDGSLSNVAGFVAQEVQQVLPDLVEEYKLNDEETRFGLKMGDMLPTMVKAIQELSAQVTTLQTQVTALKG